MLSYLIFTTACALALAGCSDHISSSTDMVFDAPGSGPDGGSDPPPVATFALVQTQVLTPSCALSGCHGDAAFPHLSPGQAYANLVGAPSSAGFPQVTAADPDASYLLTKITGGGGMFGGRMPPGAAPLDSTSIALVRAWIERGAPQD